MKDKHAPRIRGAHSTGATGGPGVPTDSTSCLDATSEAEAEALTTIYHFIIFKCHEGEAVGAASDTEETKEGRLAG